MAVRHFKTDCGLVNLKLSCFSLTGIRLLFTDGANAVRIGLRALGIPEDGECQTRSRKTGEPLKVNDSNEN